MSHEKKETAAKRDLEPDVIEIMPDGRRIVDPMSIIGSEAARRHLNDIAGIVISKGNGTKPSPA